MGKGVFERPGAKTVIIEKTDVYGAWDALHSYGYADIEHLDDVQWRYQVFVATLCARLPRMVHPLQPPRWADQNTMIIAENGLDAMGFTDGEDAFDLSVIPKAGENGVSPWAVANVAHAAEGVFGSWRLDDPLRVRASAWPPAPYPPF